MTTKIDKVKLLADLRAAGWDVAPALLASLSDYERDFMRIEMTGLRTREYYARRLDQIGFTGGGRVLDAACGIGQWSMVLAERFKDVVGLDINAGRIGVAGALAAQHGVANCTFAVGPLEQLSLADASCDAVFCYGAFMFTDMPRTLAEFRRVLRPGGKLYLNANSTGWCAHLLLDRGLRARNLALVRAALQMAMRTLRGRTSQIVVRKGWLLRQLAAAGLRVRTIGAEGTVQVALDTVPVPAAYPPRFYGMTSILEVVADG